MDDVAGIIFLSLGDGPRRVVNVSVYALADLAAKVMDHFWGMCGDVW